MRAEAGRLDLRVGQQLAARALKCDASATTFDSGWSGTAALLLKACALEISHRLGDVASASGS